MVLAYKQIGNGPAKVMVLHGWLGDHTVFEPMFAALDTARFSYVFLDYRGYGGSKALSGAYSIEEIAGDALELADHLGWDRFHLAGHSMGGSAIQRTAVAAPERIQSLFAITPVPATGVPQDDETRALFDGAADTDMNRRIIIDVTTGQRLPGAWLDWMVARSRETTTRDAFAAYLDAWRGTDFSDQVGGLKMPVRAAIGEHDLALTREVMEATYLKLYPQADLIVLPNAGHYPMLETPVWLAREMEAFFDAAG